MRKLIINADDFGFSPGVNLGIRQSLEEGIVTSLSVMVNMPSAVEVREIMRDFPHVSIGLHLNLTKGQPLLPRDQVSSLVDEQDRFINRPGKLMVVADVKQVEAEIRAQFSALQGLGVNISHVDSHHHLHYHPTVLPLVAALAREYGVKAIRYPDSAFFHRDNEEFLYDFVWDYFYPKEMSPQQFYQHWEEGKALIKDAELHMPNNYLWQFFTKGKIGIRNLMAIVETLSEGVSELICHPGRVDEELVSVSSYTSEREIELYTLTLPGIKEDIEQLGVQLVSYRAVWDDQ